MSARNSDRKADKAATKKATSAPRRARKRPANQRLSALSIAAVAGFIVTGVLVGLLLERLYRKGGSTVTDSAAETGKRSATRPRGNRPRLPGSAARSSAATARDDSAWHDVPDPIVAPAPGETPIPDDPSANPPEPEAGPDPSTYRPPTSNPGGVNGDRPPRPIRGLE